MHTIALQTAMVPVLLIAFLTLSAAGLFTFGILVVREAPFLKDMAPILFKHFDREWKRAVLCGATTSALGMVLAGSAFGISGAISAPLLAAFSAVGTVWAGLYLDGKSWTLPMIIVAVSMVALSAYLAYLSKV